jgi:hypothetical protein
MTQTFDVKGGFLSTNLQVVNITVNPTKSPSIVARLVAALSESQAIFDDSDTIPLDDFLLYDPEAKLEHNAVVKYHSLISSFPQYASFVENGYKAVCASKPTARQSIFAAINNNYKTNLGELLKLSNIKPNEKDKVLLLVKTHSDSLIEASISYIIDICKESIDAEGIDLEDIHTHCQYIVFHSFIECKILEKPR